MDAERRRRAIEIYKDFSEGERQKLMRAMRVLAGLGDSSNNDRAINEPVEKYVQVQFIKEIKTIRAKAIQT